MKSRDTQHAGAEADPRAPETIPDDAYAYLRYSLDTYDFPGIVANSLDETDLLTLGRGEAIALRTRETDQCTCWHAAFYANFDRWQPLYHAFISNVIAREFTEAFYYQAIPTLRIHFPRNLAVGEFHTDRDYGHPERELTFWVPLTPAFDTNSIWIERTQGAGDFEAVAAERGGCANSGSRISGTSGA